MTDFDDPKRIERLTPLDDVLARIDALVSPVLPSRQLAGHCMGDVLARDVRTSRPTPAKPVALYHGYAVDSASVAEAGPYAPVPLDPRYRVGTGELMPEGTDAVAPLDRTELKLDGVYAIAPVAPGEGMLATGGDVQRNAVLRRAGLPIRLVDIALFHAASVRFATVRDARVWIVGPDHVRDPTLKAIQQIVTMTVRRAGCSVYDDPFRKSFVDLDHCDCIFVYGGKGTGRHQEAINALARRAQLECHGVALSPGETAAWGMYEGVPVLVVPDRLDAALAVCATLGRRILNRLSGLMDDASPGRARLRRKVASRIGLAEVVPIRFCNDARDEVEPLASEYLPISVLADSDGFILVPADREGYPESAEVVLQPWL